MCPETLIKTYVTAVEIIPNFVFTGKIMEIIIYMNSIVNYISYLFVGVGNTLQIHDIRRNNVSSCQIFQKQRIHGIRLSESRNELVCFGNREIVLASVDLNDFRVIIRSHLVTHDWIWDIRWKNQEVIVLCANNTASLWNWKQKLNSKIVINRVKCLLYPFEIFFVRFCETWRCRREFFVGLTYFHSK